MDPTDLPPPPPSRWNRKRRPGKVEKPLPTPEHLLYPDPEDAETLIPPPPWELGVGPDPAELPVSELDNEEFRAAVEELARRQCEALRIFRALPEQERFFASEADERLAIGGNRSGKTTPMMVEVARAATGEDPYEKYPKRDGVFILVAKDLGQCARVFYRKLFMAGAFQMIRDQRTKEWRPFLPDDPEDAARADEAKPAPPLIPPRKIKSISWENKKERQPRTVQLHSGWEIWFFSSAGEWPQGVDVDGVGFDEEIEREGWYAEMAARLADRRRKNRKTGKVTSGKFMWGATPQAGTVQLYELYSRANEEQAAYQEAVALGDEVAKPTIEIFEFGLDDNPYVAAHAKAVLINKYRNNEQEYQVRIKGKFALLGLRVYPEFTPRGVHHVETFAVPHDWTRYAAIDPGRQVCAILFAAIAPPGNPMHHQVVVYDELYIRRCDAKTFGRRFREHICDQVIHQAVIDMRAGRIRELGSGLPVAEQYRRALQDEGVRFGVNDNHVSFLWSTASGGDDLKAGLEAVHGVLHVNRDGRSRFVFMTERLPFLVGEMEKYLFKRHSSGVVLEDPVQLNCHLCDDLRYLAVLPLKYVRPRARARQPGYAVRALAAKRKRKEAKDGQEAIPLY
jgi:hypothetical protein